MKGPLTVVPMYLMQPKQTGFPQNLHLAQVRSSSLARSALPQVSHVKPETVFLGTALMLLPLFALRDPEEIPRPPLQDPLP